MATVRELRAYTAIGATYGTVVEHLVHDPVPVEQLVHRLPYKLITTAVEQQKPPPHVNELHHAPF